MKHFMFALPIVAAFGGAALAQTDTTTGTGTETGTTAGTATDATGGTFGTNWPLSVGTTFFTDADSATLRATDEVATGWQSLSQEDRDMITADCTAFMAAHGEASTGASTDASATGDAAATATGTDAATTGTDAATGSAETGTAETSGTAAATDAGAATTAAAGYDMDEMKAICEAVNKL